IRFFAMPLRAFEGRLQTLQIQALHLSLEGPLEDLPLHRRRQASIATSIRSSPRRRRATVNDRLTFLPEHQPDQQRLGSAASASDAGPLRRRAATSWSVSCFY